MRSFSDDLAGFEAVLTEAYEDRFWPFLDAHGAELEGDTVDQLTMLIRDIGDLVCTMRDLRHNDLRLLLKKLGQQQVPALAEAA